MPIKVQIVFEDETGGPSLVQEIAHLQRGALSPATLGLTLAEAKALLQQLQHHLVKQQVKDYQRQQRFCPDCQSPRRLKARRPLVYRSLFGKSKLRSERLFHCDCQPHEGKSFSPLAELLPERSSPELLYFESKFAALMSYGLSVKVLSEVFPIDKHLNAATIRNHCKMTLASAGVMSTSAPLKSAKKKGPPLASKSSIVYGQNFQQNERSITARHVDVTDN